MAQILELVERGVADAKFALLATARADVDVEAQGLFQLGFAARVSAFFDLALRIFAGSAGRS